MAREFQLTAIRSVHLRVPDLAKACAFYADVWGVIEVAKQDGVTYFRGIGDDPYLLALSQGDAAILDVSWRASDTVELAELRDQMLAVGAVLEADIAPAKGYGGGTAFTILDHAKRRISIVQGDDRPAPLENDNYRPVRLAHVNINCADLEKDITFYRDGLGMLLTDQSGMMGFLRCNDDHHAIVLADAEVNTLNHVSFLHDHYDDMMRAGGKMRDAGFDIGWGPGRHGPGDNVFFYFIDPFGIVVEHTAEVLQVDDSYVVGGPSDWVWPTGRVDQWGVCPPKTDACKKAQLAIPFA